MKIRSAGFNIILLLPLAAWLCGCETTGKGGAFKKQVSTLRLHLEVAPDGTDRNGPVPVYRARPMFVNVDKEPFMHEGHVGRAEVLDDGIGFVILIRFEDEGARLFDNITTANRGRHVAVLSSFGDTRWLGAPLITRRVTDGLFQFTPDATREEAERIVLGLNAVALARGNQKKPAADKEKKPAPDKAVKPKE